MPPTSALFLILLLFGASTSSKASAEGERKANESEQSPAPVVTQQTERPKDNGSFATDIASGAEKEQKQQLRHSQLEPTQATAAATNSNYNNNHTSQNTLSNATSKQQWPKEPGNSPPALTQTTMLATNSAPAQFLLHHQPLGAGAGREPNGPQLYAQSLYSSQAPKLAFHAHSPYLKSSSTGQTQASGQLQQKPALASHCSQNPADLRCSTQTHQPLEAPSGGAQNTYTFQHMRNNYLAHHLRGQLLSSRMHNGQLTTSNPKSPDETDRRADFEIRPMKSISMKGKLIMLESANSSSSQPEAQHQPATSSHHPDQEQPTVSLDWTNQTKLIQQIGLMLDELEGNRKGNESFWVDLSENQLQFELWTELYALLAQDLRIQNLLHLDLSHNSLSKLGITFTGYIEHQLIAHNGWPQLSANGQLLSSSNTSSGAAESNNNKKGTPSRVMRHTLFLGGKLFTMIRAERIRKSNETLKEVGAKNHSLNSSLQLPIRLRSLYLSHNKLKWLIKDQFKALKHLQELRLDSNRIRYIHQHAFMGLESLRVLDLSSNQLQVIYIEQFQTNYNLLDLNVQSNNLAYIRGGTFASLANLRRLDISKNKITILSNNAFIGLESLETLNCSSNQFVHVPSASFHPLTSLRRLDLSANLITQLAPGTFFHLPIEQLWLNENSQLVSIDRGAFWDLPYLRQIYLKSSPALMSINSQAFVGTQNLETINVEDCQSLESSAKEMLENITITTTARQLRNEQQKQLDSAHTLANSSSSTSQPPINSLRVNLNEISRNISTNNQTELGKLKQSPELTQQQQQLAKESGSHHPLTTQQTIYMSEQLAHKPSKLINYIYYLGTVTFLIVILKLVFKFTSTNHYLLEARRRRRRVYEANKQNLSPMDSSSSQTSPERDSLSSLSGSSATFQLCVQPDNLLLSLNRRSLSMNLTERLQIPSSPSPPPNSSPQPDEQQQQQQQQHALDERRADESATNEIESVINERVEAVASATCCPDCSSLDQVASVCGLEEASTIEQASAGGESGAQVSANEISVINQHQQQQAQDLVGCALSSEAACCPDCSQANNSSANSSPNEEPLDDQQPQSTTIDLIHSQLIAAGFDYGHANCAHFYQSLGPALQLADITASFVNNMDYY